MSCVRKGHWVGKTIVMVTACMLITACNSSSSDDNEKQGDQLLIGDWSADSCGESVILPSGEIGSEKVSLEFSASSMTLTETLYTGENCSGEVYFEKSRYSEITLGDALTTLDGEHVRQLQGQVTSAYEQYFNQAYIDDFEQSFLDTCGFVPEVAQKVYETDCPNQSDKTTGLVFYSLYQVTGDSLHMTFGNSEAYPQHLNKGSLTTAAYYR